jgi:glutamyl-tRNA reductase
MTIDNFKAISLTHKGVPLKIREFFALDEPSCKRLLRYFIEYTDLRQVMILSTCNRTEIYYVSPEIRTESLIKIMGVEKGLSNIERFFKYFFEYNDHNDAVRHLFQVAAGLDSQVLGDKQIFHQVKRAYQWSVDHDMAGPFLHRILHTIFFTNKKIIRETSFCAGTSVASVTCDLLQTFKIKRKPPNILIIGLGKLGSDLCKKLSKLDYNNVMLINRTPEKATALGREYGFETRSLRQLIPAIKKADVVISSVAAKKPLITRVTMEKIGVLTENKYFIDLSLPRSIEGDLVRIPQMVVYNLDTLKESAGKTKKSVEAEALVVKSIITQSINEFKQWCKTMEMAPVIHAFKNALEKIRQQEIARYLKKLSPDEKDAIENISRGMVQKIVKLPVLQLSIACQRGEATAKLGALRDLFDLEKETPVELIDSNPINNADIGNRINIIGK